MVQVDDGEATKLQKYFPQVLAGFGVTMVLVQLGISSGWSSPYLAKLSHSKTITNSEASWIAALLNAGRFVGAFIGSVEVNFLGSKKTMFTTLIPIGFCWVLTMLSGEGGRPAYWLGAGRFSGGLGLGMTYSSFPLYLGEFALPEIRGAIVSLAITGAPFGVMIGNIVGSYLDLEVSAAIYLAPCVLLLALFAWLPESPHHLVKINEMEKARKSVHFYRGGIRVQEEMRAVIDFVSNSASQSFSEKLREFKQPYLMRATILAMMLWAFAQICGSNSILFYMELILTNAQVTIIRPSAVVMFVSASAVISAIISIILIDKCGRRPLLMSSSVGVTMSMVGLGTHFTMVEQGHEVTPGLQLLPIFSIFLFDVMFFLGFMCVPSAVLSELFPANVKCVAAFFASLAGAAAAFVSTKSFQPLVNFMGYGKVFFMHALITILIVPYACVYMPETKGKTLQEIQDMIRK